VAEYSLAAIIRSLLDAPLNVQAFSMALFLISVMVIPSYGRSCVATKRDRTTVSNDRGTGDDQIPLWGVEGVDDACFGKISARMTITHTTYPCYV
jgi:hypothetical protein